MAMDMLKRSIELLAHSTVSTSKDYFSNVAQMVTDTKQIATGVKDTVKKPVDFVRGMLNRSRGGGLYKLATDWFYQRSNELESYDLNGMDDDFDAGFGDDSTTDQEDMPSASLDANSMKDIARGQVGAMYQIGQKQAEVSLANTAELVTTFSNRSLEIVTAINNMTKSVINIDKNLSNLSKAYAGNTEKNQYSYDEDSNPFSSGQLTIGKMGDIFKNAISENSLFGFASVMLQQLKEEGPSALSNMLVQSLTDKIKIGDKSLREHADAINEKIGNTLHNTFTNILDSSFVKDFLGIDAGYLSSHISGSVKNDYNRNKATFDGMTRKTIVEIIPQYLSKITSALTGQVFNIDKKGKLTTQNIDYVRDKMGSAVISNAFNHSLISKGISENRINYRSRRNFNSRLIVQIQQWLTNGYVAYCFENYNRLLPYSLLAQDQNLREYVIDFAWESYERYYGNIPLSNKAIDSEFRDTCNEILNVQLYSEEGRSDFEQGVQQAIDKLRKAGKNLSDEGQEVDRVTRDQIMNWQDVHYASHNAYNILSDADKARIEQDMVHDQDYRAAEKIRKNRNIIGQRKKYDSLSEVRQFRNMSDSEKLELINGVNIDDNGTQRAATIDDLVDNNGDLSQFGLQRVFILNAMNNASTSNQSFSTANIGPTLYDNDYNGNIGSLVHDIYRHLLEGVTKVEVVNFPGRQNNSVRQILGPDGNVISTVPSSPGQGGIPSKLNLNTRGCGPIALNDLAERMNRDGLYDPEKGTNVGDYISTASNMGMNLHPGKATQRALNGSSPNNPVTVLGSGYGFGTAPGQLHYMNIVGSDGNGNLFTSNPMYGNGKFPAGAIVNNSVLGLFGSGYAQEPLTEEEQKKVDEAKKKLSELSDSAKQKLAGMDQDSTLSKLLFVLGVRNDNIDRATESLQNGVQSIGNRAHSGRGLFGKAKDKVNEWVEKTKTNISDDVRNGLDTAIGNINRRADAIKEGLQYADTTKANISNDTTISDEDKQLADQALSLMQAALQDGDGTSDLNAIKKVINKIKNNDLRQDLMNNVTGLINRSKQKDEYKPKTKIGKFILFGIGLLKKMFSPVIKGIKLAWKAFTGSLKGIWNGIKKYGKRIAKFLISPYIRGAASISVGAKSIKEGLFGKKTKLADGTYQRESGLFGELKKGLIGYKETGADGKVVKHEGLAQKVGKDFLTMGKATATKILEKSFEFYYKHIYNGAHKIGKMINKGAEKVAEGFEVFKEKVRRGKDLVVGFAQYAGKKLYDGFIAISAKIYNGVRDAVSGIKKFMAPIINKLKPFTDFVKNVVVAAPMWIKEKLSNITSTIADWATKIKNSKAFQWVKEKGTNIIKSKAVQTLKGQAKAIAGGGLDFMKGFAGGWVGVKKEAYAKGTENINKIFGDKNGGSDAQKTATAIADSNKTNTENLIKSGTENTKLLIDSFKESTQSVIDYLKESKEEEKKKEETATIDNNKTVEDKDKDKIKDKEFDSTKFSDKVKDNKVQDNKAQDDKSPRNKSYASNDKTVETDVKRDNKIDDTKTDTDKTNEPIDKDKPDETPKTEEPKADDKKPSSMMKIGGLVGKIASGVGSIFGGITKIVMTAAMQLSGFKTLVKLFKTVINTAIKPLNKLFKQIVKAIKPIIKTLTSSLTKLVEGMTEILTSILEKLTPFLEPLFNVVTDIMGAIGEDLISIITGIVKLLNPLVEGILKVAIPIIKTLHGVIEALFGGVMMGLGKIVYGIGAIISDVNVFKLEALKSVALKMMQQGNDLALAGQSKFYSGMARTIDAWSSPKVTNDNSQTTTNNSQTTIDNSQTTVINQETASEIIGSGDTQASYGTFMNMNKHGCGPIALAENINRRNSLGVYGSGDVDPRSLTVGMYNAGLYNENKGTSVADYLTTSRALGYNMTAGGVNYRSLKQASPTNPITLVGSGTGFGTKNGNTHYINVVGNDGAGSAYVSNPLTGRISKASMSELALNSKLGIYGSGPDDEKKSTVTATEQAKIDAKAVEINKTETEAKVKEATETKSGTPVAVKKKDDKTVSEIDKAKSDNLVKDVEDNTVEVERHGLEKAGHATVTTASGAAIGAGIGTAIVPGLGTLIGAIGGGLVGLLGGLFSKKDISEDPQQRRIELERQIHSGNYNADEVKVLRRILEDDIAGRLNDNNVYVVGDDVDDSGNYSGEPASINTINPEDLDFSAESIVDRYGTSTTISTLISGLKDLAANFLSIFNPEDTSTEEGKQKYLKRLKKEMGSDAYNQLRAYAFLQFFKEYPPTGLESCEPGSTGAGIYAARFKMHEYDYIKKYKDFVTKNLNNKLLLFPETDLKKFANESGISEEGLSSLNAQQLAEALCGNIDGLSSGSVNAALLAAESADSAARAGMNSSNAEFNNTAYTGSDGKTYKALGFTPQLTMPSTDNEYYKSGNKIGGWAAGGKNQHPTLSMLANCSGYAYGRVHEAVGATSPMYYSKKNGIGRDGGSWIQLAQAHGYEVDLKGESPRPGDVISWKGGQNGGHVAIVEEVKDKDHITIAHSAWNGFKGYSGDKLYFQTKELSRGSNASNPWQVWGDSWKFQGFAHHPDIQYEIANNGSSAYGDPSQLFSNGGSVDENIYRYLISKGMSGVGAAGMMGCMKEESGLKSNNLEDKFQKSWGYPTGDSGDVQYTQNVNSGKETQNMFVNSHGTGKAGYGLTQFTASNVKQALYNNTVAKGKSIDDYGAQLDSVLDTLKGSRYNGSTLYDAISNSTDPVTANKLFLWRYEAGTGFTSDSAVAAKYPWMGMEGINKRHTNASAYYNKFKGLSPYTPQQSGSNASAINPYADQQFVSGAVGGTGGKDSLIKTTASIYEAYEKVMPKTFDKRYQNSLYSKPITLRNGKTRKLRPDCSGIVSAGIQEMGYKLKGIGDDGKRSWEFAGPTSNTMILDQNGNPSRDWEVLQFSRDKLQPGDITAGYWKTHGHVSIPIVHLDKTMPQGLDGGGNTNITNSINVAKQLLAGKSYSSVDYGPRSSGHYAMGSSWDSKTGGGAQRIWRYVGGSKDDTTPQYDSRGFKLNTGYHTAYMITRKNGSDILVDSAGNRLGSVMNVKTIASGGSGFYNSTPKPFRMSSKWQTADKDNWLYDYIDGITGAGDTSSKSSVYIPPIDSNSFLSDALLNQDSAKSVNNYYVAKDSSDEKRQELNILLNHTFNVRSESMEAILTEMLEELRKRGSSRQPVAVPSPATTPSLFDNDGIPPQIDRLIT